MGDNNCTKDEDCLEDQYCKLIRLEELYDAGWYIDTDPISGNTDYYPKNNPGNIQSLRPGVCKDNVDGHIPIIWIILLIICFMLVLIFDPYDTFFRIIYYLLDWKFERSFNRNK